MSTEMTPRPSSRWSARHYILAAVVAMLAAIAIVAAISISLSPAHISFSVARATMSISDTYNLIITANNTSRRRAVEYDFMSAEIWSSPTTSFPKEINISEALPEGQRQEPWSPVTFHVDIDYKQFDVTTDNNSTSSSVNNSDCKVVVSAKVRFWVGHVPTRPYTIRGTCMHVNFLYSHNISDFPVKCAMY